VLGLDARDRSSLLRCGGRAAVVAPARARSSTVGGGGRGGWICFEGLVGSRAPNPGSALGIMVLIDSDSLLAHGQSHGGWREGWFAPTRVLLVRFGCACFSQPREVFWSESIQAPVIQQLFLFIYKLSIYP
jgi:hypothetical protein